LAAPICDKASQAVAGPRQFGILSVTHGGVPNREGCKTTRSAGRTWPDVFAVGLSLLLSRPGEAPEWKVQKVELSTEAYGPNGSQRAPGLRDAITVPCSRKAL
jgi:hypothetical protein